MSVWSRRQFLQASSVTGVLMTSGCLRFITGSRGGASPTPQEPADQPIKDTDGDGVINTEDYAPWDADVQTKGELRQSAPTATSTTPTPRAATTTGTQAVQLDSFEDGSHTDRWTVLKNQADASAAVVSERAHTGEQSLKIHIGETYSGDYRLGYTFDTDVTDGQSFQCWCYPAGPGVKLLYNLWGPQRRVKLGFAVGDVKYGVSSSETKSLLTSYSPQQWYRFVIVPYPSRTEVQVRVEAPTGEVLGEDTLSTEITDYTEVRIFAGDYSGNVNVYLDDVAYAPASPSTE